MEPTKSLSVVAVDNYRGGYMATEHLMEQGYRRIAHISGPLAWWESRQRKKGWEDALRDAGIEISEHHSIEGTWSFASGFRAIQQLQQSFPEMDAVFVANDQMALSVLHFALKKGIRVPDELAVVGFDGIPDGAYYWPPLTTINQDQNALGRTAVQEIVKVIERGQHDNKSIGPKVKWLQPTLIVRESSTSFDQFAWSRDGSSLLGS